MKKMMLGLVVVVMMFTMVGCGETKKEEIKENGFVPEQVTESPVITEEVKEEIEEVIDTENLQKYYDVTKCIGTPSLVKMRLDYKTDNDTMVLTRQIRELELTITWEMEKPADLLGSGNLTVEGIVCDNNTPDDYTDDVVAYVFMK